MMVLAISLAWSQTLADLQSQGWACGTDSLGYRYCVTADSSHRDVPAMQRRTFCDSLGTEVCMVSFHATFTDYPDQKAAELAWQRHAESFTGDTGWQDHPHPSGGLRVLLDGKRDVALQSSPGFLDVYLADSGFIADGDWMTARMWEGISGCGSDPLAAIGPELDVYVRQRRRAWALAMDAADEPYIDRPDAVLIDESGNAIEVYLAGGVDDQVANEELAIAKAAVAEMRATKAGIESSPEYACFISDQGWDSLQPDEAFKQTLKAWKRR